MCIRGIKILLIFLLASSGVFAESNPCVGSSNSLEILSNDFESNINRVSGYDCIEQINNLDFDDYRESCNCLKPHFENIKSMPLISDKEKHENVGKFVIGKIETMSEDFAILDSLMPSLKDSKELANICNVDNLLSFDGCGLPNQQAMNKIKKIFGFHLDKNIKLGVMGSNTFSIENLRNKIVKETRVKLDKTAPADFKTSYCEHPSFNFKFLGSKIFNSFKDNDKKSDLYKAIFENEYNDEKMVADQQVFKLFFKEVDGSVDTKGIQLLKSNWKSFGNSSTSDISSSKNVRDFIEDKLKRKCVFIKNEINKLSCNEDISHYGKNIEEKDKKFKIEDIAMDISDTSENLSTKLGEIKGICQRNSNMPIYKDYDNLLKPIKGDIDNPTTAYQGATLEATNEVYNITDLFSPGEKKEGEGGTCEDLCVQPIKLDNTGFCIKQPLDEVMKKFDCANKDTKHKKKCAYLSLMEENQVVDKIQDVYAELSDSEKNSEKGKSLLEQLRIRGVSVTKNNELLDKFLNVKKPETTKEIAKAPSDSTKPKTTSLNTIKVGKTPNEPKQQTSQPTQKAKVKVAKTNPAQTAIDMDAALNRLESSGSSLSFGRSSKGKSKGSKYKKGDSDISSASKKLDGLLSTLDDLRKDNSDIDNILANMGTTPYQASTGNNGGLPSSSGSGYSNRLASNSVPGNYVSSGSGGAGSVSGAPGSGFGDNGLSNPSGGSYVGDIARTDLVGKSSTGVSSPEDGDLQAQSAPGVRGPTSVRGGSSSSSPISQLFQGQIEASNIQDNTKASDLIEVEISRGVKEVNLAELLKNRDEINPGEAFILYEVVGQRKVEVTLIPTFSNFKGKRFFAGYRPLDVNGSNKILVDKLKAEKNLLTQN